MPPFEAWPLRRGPPYLHGRRLGSRIVSIALTSPGRRAESAGGIAVLVAMIALVGVLRFPTALAYREGCFVSWGRDGRSRYYVTLRRRTGKDLYDGVPLCGS
jgi:hypothetical protein